MRDKKREFAVHHGCSPFKMNPIHPTIGAGVALPALALVVLMAVAVLVGLDSAMADGVMLAAPSVALVAAREKLKKAEGELESVFEKAGKDLDLSKVDKFGADDGSDWSTVQKTEWIRSQNEKISDLHDEFKGLLDAEKARGDLDSRRGSLRHPEPGEPESNGKGRREALEIKTLGEHLVGAEGFKAFQRGQKGQVDLEKVYPSEVLAAQALKNGLPGYLKTLMTTSAGWAPESLRIGRVVPDAVRPIQVLDIIPMNRTSEAAVVYMEETTRTHNAAETAEGASYPEDAFALTEQSSSVKKIATSIPVTDEQLADVQQVRGYLNNRLIFSVRQRLDGQVLTGDGTGSNLTGLLNASGLQTQALGSDPVPDAIYKAMTLVRVTGRANPSAVILHPNDWQSIRLLRTADGVYIWGSPSEAGPERIWGLPVAVSDAITENTGLVGDFENFCSLFERQGVTVETGYVGTQFTEGEQTLRAQMRAAFVVFRGAAFAEVTGI